MLAPPDKRRSPKLEKTLGRLLELETAPNIADILDDDDSPDGKSKGLRSIGHEVVREYTIDKTSRSDWETSAQRAMDIALQVRQPKNYPFQGAANIKYPLVTVAALQFGARAYPAIIDGNRIVKATVQGRDDGIPLPPQGMQLPPGLGGIQGQMPPQMTGGMSPGGNAPAMAGPLSGHVQAGAPPSPEAPPDQPMGGQPQQQWLVPPGAKRAKAERVSKHMSWQLLSQMEEWEEDTDVLLHHLPIVGCAFRKVWRSEELGRNKAEMVPAVHLVVNNRVRNLDEAPRVTHEVYLYPQQIEERKLSGTFLDVDLPKPTTAQTDDGGDTVAVDGDDDDAPHLFLEQHRYLDLDNDEYREPYIVTVHKDSQLVVRIVANYRMERIKDDSKRITLIPKEQYFVKYSFIPDPKGGFYDIGFGKLLESLGETIDTTINQMLDAGHLQNAGGGLIGTGIRFKKNKIAVTPGKYEQVELSGKLADQIYAHQFQGPSAVLFNLLGMMIEAARDITAVKDILTGDTGDKGVQTATTTLAMIEQGLKVFTAIYKRVYRSLKREFKLLFELNARYIDQQEYFTLLDEQQAIEKSDYDLKSMDIMPVADPKMVTDMQRSARGNVLLQIAASPLGVAQNPAEALKRIYDAAGFEEPEKLINQGGPSPEQQLAMATAEADIKQKTAQAGLHEVTAQKVAAETQKVAKETEILEPSTMHAAHMAENSTRIESSRLDLEREKLAQADRASADSISLEREKIAQAERGQSAELEHKRGELAAKVKDGEAKEAITRDKAGLPKRESFKQALQDLAKMFADQHAQTREVLDGITNDIKAPVEIVRGKDGKATGARKGGRVMNLKRDGEGRPTSLQ